MKAVWKLLATIAMIGTTLTVAATPSHGVAGFDDVDAGAYYAASVQWMVDWGVTTGTSPCTFDPDANVTRGELAAFLWRSQSRPAAWSAPFPDVTASWQKEPVAWMIDRGITTGTSPTTFSPDAPATRGEIVVFLYRLAGYPWTWSDSHPFSDVSASWQHDAVTWASDHGITTGTTPSTFSPDALATRGQVATLLYRFYGSPWVTVDPSSGNCGGSSGGGGSAATPVAPLPGGYGTAAQPFSPDSYWNIPLADNTANGDNGPWNLSGANLTLNRSNLYGHPLYNASNSDPTFTVRISNYENQALGGSQGYQEIQFKIPAGVSGSGGSDGHMAIVWGDRLLELYQAGFDGSSWYASYAVEQSISGDGRQSGTRAHGNAGIAGLIQGWEVDAGVINHKVNLMVEQAWLTRTNGDHFFPATRSDNFGYGNDSRGAHMGETFRIPATVDLNSLGLSGHGLILARALQDFGGVVSDQAGARSLGATNWDAGHFQPSYQDLETISDLLVRVTSVSAQNPGGGV